MTEVIAPRHCARYDVGHTRERGARPTFNPRFEPATQDSCYADCHASCPLLVQRLRALETRRFLADVRALQQELAR